MRARMAIYFIQSEKGGPIKIGHTRRLPATRLEELQRTCPVRLQLLGRRPGSTSEEAKLHRILKQYRLHGEWFLDHPDVWKWIPQQEDQEGLDAEIAEEIQDGQREQVVRAFRYRVTEPVPGARVTIRQRVNKGRDTYHLRWKDPEMVVWRSKAVGTDSNRAEREAARLEVRLEEQLRDRNYLAAKGVKGA